MPFLHFISIFEVTSYIKIYKIYLAIARLQLASYATATSFLSHIVFVLHLAFIFYAADIVFHNFLVVSCHATSFLTEQIHHSNPFLSLCMVVTRVSKIHQAWQMFSVNGSQLVYKFLVRLFILLFNSPSPKIF